MWPRALLLTALPVLVAACSPRSSSSDARATGSAGALIRPDVVVPSRASVTSRFAPKIPDVAPFLALGCKQLPYYLDCAGSEAVKAIGCQNLTPASEYLGALSPALGLAQCDVTDPQGKQTGIIQTGCRLPYYRRYVVAEGGKATLIRSAAEFTARFAPVETPDEALAFAVALTKAVPRTTIELPPDAAVKVATIEPTYVETTPEGYRVHLFDYVGCGCGPHDHQVVDFLVTRDGQLRQLSRAAIYDVPSERALCVD